MSSTKGHIVLTPAASRRRGSAPYPGLCVWVLSVFVTTPAMAIEPEQMAKELASMRAEVEQLATELEDQEARHQARMRSLENQRADVELELRREESQLKIIQDELTEISALLDAREDDQILTDALYRCLDATTASIQSGIPFRIEDRLAAVSALREQIENNSVSSAQGAARAWALVEDEIRLTAENAIDREVLSLGGEPVLVEVARLGMVTLYYRSPEGTVGHLTGSTGAWDWQEITDPDEIALVVNLFDNLQKGVRTGWFELPLHLQASQ